MLLKNKLIIASSALIVAVGAAIGTSTFAWFVSGKQATVSTDVLISKGKNGSIEITKNTGINNAATTWDSTAYKISPTTDYSKFKDISGYGNTAKFYERTKTTSDGTTADLSAVSTANGGKGSYLYFALTVSNNDTGTNFDLYLGAGTDILPSTTGSTDQAKIDANLSKAARMSVKAGDDQAVVFGRDDDSTANAATKYVTDASTNTVLSTNTNTAKFSDLATTTASNDYKARWTNGFTTDSELTVKEPTDKLCTIIAGGSVTVSCVIWFEGQDAECIMTNDANTNALSGDIKIQLNFLAAEV